MSSFNPSLDEAMILGRLASVEMQVEITDPLLRRIDLLGLDIYWVPFLDALTGGGFSNPGRAADAARAENVQIYAAKLMAAYQTALVNSY